MKVSLIQMNSQENKDANLKKAEQLIAQAVADDHPDMVVLPEMFTCLTESAEVRSANADKIPGGETYGLLRDLAQRHRIFVHGGSLLESDGDDVYNTTGAFDAKGNDETGAPDLTGRLRSASTEVGIFNIIREGVPGTAMLPVDADLPDATVWQLVSYIGSLRYDPSTVELDGNADAGVALFRGKGDCDSCHMVHGQGGRLGPDLSRVGENALGAGQVGTALDGHRIVDLLADLGHDAGALARSWLNARSSR